MIAYLSFMLIHGLNFILIPIINKNLSENDLKFWLIALNMLSLFTFIDASFRQNVSRLVAQARAGRLTYFGQMSQGIDVKYNRLPYLTAIITGNYATLCLSTCAIGMTGSLYLVIVDFELNYVTAWLVLCVGQFFSLCLFLFAAVLNGENKISSSNIVQLITKFTFIISLMLIILITQVFNFAILSSTITLGFLFIIFFWKVFINKARSITHLSELELSIIRSILLKSSSKMLVVSIFGFFIVRGSIFTVGLIDDGNLVSYAFVVLIMTFISTISSIPFQYYAPTLNFLQMAKDKKSVRNIMKYIYLISIFSFISLTLLCVTIYHDIFKFSLGDGKEMKLWIFILIAVIFFLEMLHSIACSYLTTLNKIPFSTATILTSISALILGWIFAIKLGFVGVIVGLGLSQLVFNNWYWPYVMWKDLKC